MAYLTQNSAPTSALRDRTQSFFDGVKTYFKRRQLKRETFDGLSALSNRDLADLGIHRSEIGRLARESAQNAQL